MMLTIEELRRKGLQRKLILLTPAARLKTAPAGEWSRVRTVLTLLALTLLALALWLAGCASSGQIKTEASLAAAPASRPTRDSAPPPPARPPMQIIEQAAKRVGIDLSVAKELAPTEKTPHPRWKIKVDKVSLGCLLKLLQQIEAEGPELGIRTILLSDRWQTTSSLYAIFEVRSLPEQRGRLSLLRKGGNEHQSVLGGLREVLRQVKGHAVVVHVINLRPDGLRMGGSAALRDQAEKLRQALAALPWLDRVRFPSGFGSNRGKTVFSLAATVKLLPRSVSALSVECRPSRATTSP